VALRDIVKHALQRRTDLAAAVVKGLRDFITGQKT